ncbi:MAG: protein kinase [Solirubrobacteraceae bacterium]
MSTSLGLGSTFAGCRLESVAGRGGMGVVFRATQLALGRPVALKAIAPELAADAEYRERFQSESQLAAIIDHPNVIPVYEAGESDETLYLIMRWIDGTDLRQLFNKSPQVSARRAIRLLRPVGSALAAAHRHGLVHRDVKPANVLIAPGYDDDDEDHIYLTDFGIARRSDGKSLTGTGKFVGTIDYMAPERIEGKKGDASCDTYSLGCMLFEALTGHVPFNRPTDISKMFAHVNDPVPSARAEVDGVPELLDEIITKSMAKRPEDRFGSAGEMTAALGRALLELETGERTIVSAPQATVRSPAATAEPTELPEPTAAASEPTAAMSEPTAAMSEPTAVMREPGATVAQPPARRSRRSPVLWALSIAALAVAAVVVVVLSGGSKTAGAGVQIRGSGLTQGRTITVSGPAGSISVGIQNVWVSLPGRDEIVRSSVATGAQQTFPAAGSPTAIAAGVSAVWVAEPGLQALAQFNGDSGKRVHSAKLPGTPVALALDQQDSSAWVADSSGAITHVAVGGTVAGTPGHSTPPASSLGWGEGWVWGTNGTSKGLVRVDPSTNGSTETFFAGSGPIGVALDQGVWTANADGRLTRFDPQPGQLRPNADLAVAPELDAVAATDPGPFVWALSKKTKTLYRVTATGTPAVTGTVVFGSPPVALAAAATSVWVALQDGEVVQIQFS